MNFPNHYLLVLLVFLALHQWAQMAKRGGHTVSAYEKIHESRWGKVATLMAPPCYLNKMGLLNKSWMASGITDLPDACQAVIAKWMTHCYVYWQEKDNQLFWQIRCIDRAHMPAFIHQHSVSERTKQASKTSPASASPFGRLSKKR